MHLNDIERKVLTIIRNTFMLKNEFPTINELVIRTGKTRKEVEKILSSLVEQKYISRDKEKNKLKLSQEWERKRDKINISFLG
jgi:DNA-binding IclR family transcriptional regulator